MFTLIHKVDSSVHQNKRGFTTLVGLTRDNRHAQVAIETKRVRVPVAHLKIDMGSAALRESLKRRQHKCATDAAPPRARMHGDILDEIRRPALRHADHLLAVDSKKDQRRIEPGVLAQLRPPFAEDRRAPAAFPEPWLKNGMRRLGVTLVRLDGVDAPKRHRCAKVEVSTTLLDGGVRGEG